MDSAGGYIPGLRLSRSRPSPLALVQQYTSCWVHGVCASKGERHGDTGTDWYKARGVGGY